MFEKPQFICPVCGNRLPTIESTVDLHLDCRACGAELVLDFKYFWFFRLLCALGAVLLAYYQKLEGPIFVVVALIYNLILFFVGARTILPFFPQEIRVFSPPFTTLRINK